MMQLNASCDTHDGVEVLFFRCKSETFLNIHEIHSETMREYP